MKRHILFSFLALPLIGTAQTVIYAENFDAYTAGTMIAEADGTHWSTWTASPGGPEDAAVSAAYAMSGANSLGVISDNATDGGPTDLLLKLGDRTTGVYTLSWQMYIPADRGGYFNIQHNEDVTPASFAAEVIFLADGTLDGAANNTAPVGTYPHDEWFLVGMLINLNSNTAVLTVDDVPVLSWPFNTITDGSTSTNQLGAVDFFAFGGGTDLGEYYVDDLAFVDITAISAVDEHFVDGSAVYPNPMQDELLVSMPAGHVQRTQATLLDATGRIVRTNPVINGDRFQFDVAGLNSGVYFLRLVIDGRENVKKVVKR
jgi:hypothetical protein